MEISIMNEVALGISSTSYLGEPMPLSPPAGLIRLEKPSHYHGLLKFILQ